MITIVLFATVGCGGKYTPGSTAHKSQHASTEPKGEHPPVSLEGNYSVLKMYLNQKWVTNTDIKRIQGKELAIQFKGDVMIDASFGNEGTRTFKMDPSKSPAEIDFYPQGSTVPNRAIYKIEDVTLTLCMGGTQRPNNFSPSGDVFIMVLKKK
ncbi:unnamed protein product [Gemmataceae bacterium]|nr:unnamed protein product [Gemmataceae bacterium]VTT99890.1 unnamed protein product [Gemmataceae bacterium]